MLLDLKMGYSDAPCVPEEYKKYKNRMGRGDGMAEASGGALGSVQVYRVSFHQHLPFLFSFFFFWVKLLKLLKKY